MLTGQSVQSIGEFWQGKDPASKHKVDSDRENTQCQPPSSICAGIGLFSHRYTCTSYICHTHTQKTLPVIVIRVILQDRILFFHILLEKSRMVVIICEVK